MHLDRTGRPQNLRSGIEGRPRRDDIIDHQHAHPRRNPASVEHRTQPAACPIPLCLRRPTTTSHQPAARQPPPRRNRPSKELGLIKAAAPLGHSPRWSPRDNIDLRHQRRKPSRNHRHATGATPILDPPNQIGSRPLVGPRRGDRIDRHGADAR